MGEKFVEYDFFKDFGKKWKVRNGAVFFQKIFCQVSVCACACMRVCVCVNTCIYVNTVLKHILMLHTLLVSD